MKKVISLLIFVCLLFSACGSEKGESAPSATAVATSEKARVKTKIEFSKEVNVPEEYKNSDYLPHQIFVPEIIDDGEEVKSVNEEMYSVSKDYLDLLKRDGEQGMLININYYSCEKDGIISVLIESETGTINSGFWKTYHCFYYDSVNNKRFTEEEFYLKMDFSKADVLNRIKSSPDFIMNSARFSNATLDVAIFDDDLIYAVINTTADDNTLVIISRY